MRGRSAPGCHRLAIRPLRSKGTRRSGGHAGHRHRGKGSCIVCANEPNGGGDGGDRPGTNRYARRSRCHAMRKVTAAYTARFSGVRAAQGRLKTPRQAATNSATADLDRLSAHPEKRPAMLGSYGPTRRARSLKASCSADSAAACRDTSASRFARRPWSTGGAALLATTAVWAE